MGRWSLAGYSQHYLFAGTHSTPGWKKQCGQERRSGQLVNGDKMMLETSALQQSVGKILRNYPNGHYLLRMIRTMSFGYQIF